MADIGKLAYGITLDHLNHNQDHAPDVNRYLGGHNRGVDSHPYIKGYFYVFFGFPPTLFSDGGDSSSNTGITSNKALIYLLSAAESFTPPGDRQLKIEEIQGMGGVDSSFVSGQTIDRNFSIQYRDYWGAPIFRIHRQWTQYFNPYFGGAAYAPNIAYMAREYKGTCMLIQTKPVTKLDSQDWSPEDIVKIFYFDGVVPTTDLSSVYDSNITDNSVVRPTVQYRFDGFPLDETNDEVLSKALTVLKTVRYDTKNASPAIYEDMLDGVGDVPHGINYNMTNG
jgi:hypothetical protein